MRGPSHDTGFTLLEILIVTLIAGLLTLTLRSGLSTVSQGWINQKKITSATEEMQSMETALRGLIARAETSDTDQPPSLSGKADRLRLITWLPAAQGYQHDIEAGLGVNASHQLVMRWRPFYRGTCRGDHMILHEEILAHDIRAVTFSYYGRDEEGEGWQSTWEKTTLPLLIRIHSVPDNAEHSWPDIDIHPLLSGSDTL